MFRSLFSMVLLSLLILSSSSCDYLRIQTSITKCDSFIEKIDIYVGCSCLNRDDWITQVTKKDSCVICLAFLSFCHLIRLKHYEKKNTTRPNSDWWKPMTRPSTDYMCVCVYSYVGIVEERKRNERTEKSVSPFISASETREEKEICFFLSSHKNAYFVRLLLRMFIYQQCARIHILTWLFSTITTTIIIITQTQ